MEPSKKKTRGPFNSTRTVGKTIQNRSSVAWNCEGIWIHVLIPNRRYSSYSLPPIVAFASCKDRKLSNYVSVHFFQPAVNVVFLQFKGTERDAMTSGFWPTLPRISGSLLNGKCLSCQTKIRYDLLCVGFDDDLSDCWWNKILHHLVLRTPCKEWVPPPINWCRISSIKSIFLLFQQGRTFADVDYVKLREQSWAYQKKLPQIRFYFSGCWNYVYIGTFEDASCSNSSP